MLSDTSYINAVWNKYDDYCSGKIQDDFFEKRVYREETNENRFLKAVAMFIITVLTTIGVVYAGIVIYNNFKNKTAYINFNNSLISQEWVDENMKNSAEEQHIYYASIKTYEEYLRYKEKIGNLEEFIEEDFNDNFVVLICGAEINVQSLETDNDTLYINFTSSFTKGEQNVNELLVPNEQYRENIKLVRKYDKSEFVNIAIEDIPSDYTKEQAIADGFVVTENNKIISNNENDIYDFIEKSKNGENCFIRFVLYNEMGIDIKDIEYKGQKYRLNERILYKNGKEEFKYKNYECDTIEIVDSILLLKDKTKNYNIGIISFN